MRIIEIEPLPNGAHRNQSGISTLPPGWAEIPESLAIPDTFPFVSLTVSGGVVTGMAAGEMPAQEPLPEPEPTDTERISALEAQRDAILGTLDFYEECIAEMAAEVYQ